MSKRARKPVSATAILDSIQRLAEQDPEAFGTLFVQVTIKLSQVDRAAYDWVMSGMIQRTSEEWGVTHALDEVKQKLASGDVKGAIEALKPIEAWDAGIEYLASVKRLAEYVM